MLFRSLFNATESNIAPATSLTIGSQPITATAESIAVNQPAWRYAVLGLLAFLLLEWVIYNKRVFV